MTGGLMQLVAYGAQDIYLTGNPQITFFKIVYRRHTDFAIEGIDCVFIGTASLGNTAVSIITKSGDLLSKMYLKATLTASSGSTSLVKSVTIADGTSKNKIINSSNIIDTNTDSSPTITTATHNGLIGQYKIILGSGTLSPLIKEGDIVSYTNSGTITWFEITCVLNKTTFYVTNDETTDFSTYDTTDFALNFYKNNEVGYVRNIGYALLDYVELQIGGARIDRHYGLWMSVWDELCNTHEMNKARDSIIGNDGDSRINSDGTIELFVPLQFSCCKNYGLAIPLISLYYHDVTLEFSFEGTQSKLISDNSDFTVALSSTSVVADYIFLNTEERKRFAQAAHEYLIEQVQYMGEEEIVESVKNKYKLYFNHPCKELIWATKTSANQHCDFTDMVSLVSLNLNGELRFEEQSGKYFGGVQPFQHHKKIPKKGIYMYSFAINPEDHQPSGTCNFSRIDSSELDITTRASLATSNYVHIYTRNYNVLRVMSGMGGVAFSN